jgi:hypothetical protein
MKTLLDLLRARRAELAQARLATLGSITDAERVDAVKMLMEKIARWREPSDIDRMRRVLVLLEGPDAAAMPNEAVVEYCQKVPGIP